MKKIFFIPIIISFVSCTSIQTMQIGQLNMISTRNIDSNFDYSQISTYSGSSQKELRTTKAISVEDAVNSVVKSVPGGEFLMNVKLYRVKRGDNYFYSVEGDVWGKKESVSYRGFKEGDNVVWSTIKGVKTGVIKSLRNDTLCLVLIDGSDKIIEISYDKISKYIKE